MRERYTTAVKDLNLSVPPCDMAEIESTNFDCAKNSYLHTLAQQDTIEPDYCFTKALVAKREYTVRLVSEICRGRGYKTETLCTAVSIMDRFYHFCQAQQSAENNIRAPSCPAMAVVAVCIAVKVE